MDNELRQRMLEEVRRLSNDDVLADHEFAVKDYMAMTGLSRTGARSLFNRLIDQGKLETGFRFDPRSNCRVRAYWFKEKPKAS